MDSKKHLASSNHLEEAATHDEDTQPSAATHVVTETQRLHASRMEEALLHENPNPWRKSLLRLYACIFVGFLCSATNGFDANTFGESRVLQLQ